MILRRIVVSLVLILFAAVSVGVIIGLDSSARGALVGQIVGSPAPVDPPASSEPSASAARTASARPSPSPTPTASTPTVSVPTAAATPKASATPKAPATPKASVAPRPTATAKPSVRPKPKPKASRKPTPKPSKSYLKGRLSKGKGGTVYLTFDDGPGPYTRSVLSVLSRTGSTATFFQLGVNQRGYPHVAAAIRAQGSNVANHTYDHPDLTRLKASQVRWQIDNGPRAKCLRPPYGATDASVRTAIARAGLRQVLWDVDTLDWSKPGVAHLARTGRLKGISAGSVILMHDGGGDRAQTVAALPTIIADLQARGFKVRALPYC